MLPVVPKHVEINGKTDGCSRGHSGLCFLLLIILCAAFNPRRCHAQRTLCDDGFGDFSFKLQTGVEVTVGAAKNQGFASHSCDALLRWGTKTLYAAQGATQVDIDVLGADLGLGAPVVAFQVKRSALTSLMTYEIYSLKKPPRLLKTITGGDAYDAQDYSLNGENAIWTDDAAAADGFDGLPLFSYDFPPTVILRFEKGQLIDVSSEHQQYYDRQIAKVEAQLNAAALNKFKNSDGKLSSTSINLEDQHTLIRTKVKVLEIVWAYLYSGREQQAWSELEQMWPAADLTRIRGAIQFAYAGGILRQVDEVEKTGQHPRKRRHALVYDMTTREREVVSETAMYGLPMGGQIPEKTNATSSSDSEDRLANKVEPVPIYLGITFPQGETPARSQSRIYLNLVIDEAGKVRSAKLANKADAGPIGDTLIRASANWNFIPGTRAGRAVACRIRLGVSPNQ